MMQLRAPPSSLLTHERERVCPAVGKSVRCEPTHYSSALNPCPAAKHCIPRKAAVPGGALRGTVEAGPVIGRHPPGAHSRVSSCLERAGSHGGDVEATSGHRRSEDARQHARTASAGASLSHCVAPPTFHGRFIAAISGSAAPVRRAAHPRAAGAARRGRKRPLTPACCPRPAAHCSLRGRPLWSAPAASCWPNQWW